MIDEKKLIESSTWHADKFFHKFDSTSYHMGWNDCNRDWVKRIGEQRNLSLENKTSETDVPDNNVGKWIPVTERLPKKIGWYRVTLKSFFDGHRCIDWGSYGPKFGWGASGEVVAWMEEPEPYKGEE